ncbi:MAG: hypothetical protein ICV60_02975 [Pyrinomonadaceae bacterium]|nr:hypothetical protein [Pyrinomonadaceae bacterium]
MYCPSCGLQQTQDLRYCPRCGANLAPINQESPAPSLVGPIWAVSVAVTLITLAGFGFIFIFALILISKGITINGSPLLLIMFFLLVVLIIAVLLSRQLSRLLSLYHTPQAQTKNSARAKTGELAGSAAAPQLEAVSEYPVSVTESTTRTFEPAPGDRQTKQNIP